MMLNGVDGFGYHSLLPGSREHLWDLQKTFARAETDSVMTFTSLTGLPFYDLPR